MWGLREAALGLSMAMKGDAKSMSFVEDTAVPPERLRDYIDALPRSIIREARHRRPASTPTRRSAACTCGRWSTSRPTTGVAQFEAIADEVADLVLEFGGALSGEHGDGLVRSPFSRRCSARCSTRRSATMKQTFDPDGIFNPGKIVDAPPLTANLRYGAGYRDARPATYFDYSATRRLRPAPSRSAAASAPAARSSRARCARRTWRRATRSTPRAAAPTSCAWRWPASLGEAGLGDDGVYEVLDLCLECRACKSRVPGRRGHGAVQERVPRRPLAAARRAAPGARLRPRARAGRAGAAGWRRRQRHRAAARRALRWASGCWASTAGARLPPLDAPHAVSKARGAAAMAGDARDAVLFADTFTEHGEPEIGEAAVEVLEAAGLAARLVPHGCCGRPLNLAGAARRGARHWPAQCRALHDAARAARRSSSSSRAASRPCARTPRRCCAARRRRKRAHRSRRQRAVRGVPRTRAGGGRRLPLRAGPRAVLLHAHCHQRAMGLAPAQRAAVAHSRHTVTDLDAGCCGMAGSFGYGREHYDVSRAIGERKLFPAARGLAPDAVLVAAGTSCRHQVAHFAAVDAVHPAVLLRSLLEVGS